MSERLARYNKAREDRIAGKYNGAPLYLDFPRLGTVLPAIPRSSQIMLLGGSGIGKSQSWVGLILMPVYSLIKLHGYKAKFFIYLLEDSITMLEDRLFSRILYTKFGLYVDPLDLNSLKKELLPEDVIAKFNEVDEIVEDILRYCVVNESIMNPTGIYKDLRTHSGELGVHHWEDREFTYKNDDGSTYQQTVKVYKEYIPNDPDLHCFVILDNLNNLAAEGKGDTGESMNRWCRDYGRLQITKHWHYTVVNIQQTALETDRKQFDFRGENVLEKLEPNLSSLGTNKEISRDHHIILALFSPDRFGINNYEGYAITQLRDNFRALLIIKSNVSMVNVKIPLFFAGSSSYYAELPASKDMTPELYKQYSVNLNLLTKK